MPALAAGTTYTLTADHDLYLGRYKLLTVMPANTGWQLLVGAACGAVGAAAAGEHWPTHWPAPVLAAMAFHIIVAMAFAYVIWFVLLARCSATVASLTTLAVPVVGVLGAMALVGDRPAALDWLGFALVLGGAALVALRLGGRP